MRSPRPEHAGGDLGLDRESTLPQPQRAKQIGAHRLVAGHHIGDPAVVDQVGRKRDGLVPDHVPEAEGRVGRPHPRCRRRHWRLRTASGSRSVRVGGSVFQVGIEDRGEIARRVGERCAYRGALSEVSPVKPNRTLSGRSAAVSSSRVPSVEPSSTITSSRPETGARRQRIVDRCHDRACSLNTGIRIVRVGTRPFLFWSRGAADRQHRLAERWGPSRLEPAGERDHEGSRSVRGTVPEERASDAHPQEPRG